MLYLIEKTIEGTAAGITSVLAACSVLLPVLASTGYIFTEVFSLSLSVSPNYRCFSGLSTWSISRCKRVVNKLFFKLIPP